MVANLLQVVVRKSLVWKRSIDSCDEGMTKCLQGCHSVSRVYLQNLLHKVDELKYLFPLIYSVLKL